MRSMNHAQAFKILAFSALGTAACKAPTLGSRLQESGGAQVSWNMSAVLDPQGNINVDAKGTNANQDDSAFVGLTLQVANVPDGAVQTWQLVEKRFIALASGSRPSSNLPDNNSNIVPVTPVAPSTGDAGGALFHILATNRAGGFCYINGGKLDGTYYAVACKTNTSPDSVSADDQKRRDLVSSCQRLSTSRIDGAGVGDFYTRYDSARSTYSCTCLNGKARDIDYRDYYGTAKSVMDFEADCKLRLDPSAPPPGGTSSGSLTFQQKLDAVKTACKINEGLIGITCNDREAICGPKSRKSFAYQNYLERPLGLKADCERQLDLDNGADPTSPLSRLVGICANEIGPATKVSTDGNGCECPNGRLDFSNYLTNIDGFVVQCRGN